MLFVPRVCLAPIYSVRCCNFFFSGIGPVVQMIMLLHHRGSCMPERSEAHLIYCEKVGSQNFLPRLVVGLTTLPLVTGLNAGAP
jgi:hypothetical protein